MWLPILLIIAALAVFALIILHARVVFVLELADGRALVRRGRVPLGFPGACEDVARLHRVRQGRITGVRGAGGVRLAFSREIPERTRQAFRNVWTPPPGGGDGGGRRAAG